MVKYFSNLITTNYLLLGSHLCNGLSLFYHYSPSGAKASEGKPLTIHQKYMQRCLELAKLGAGTVAPNPMVGAVLIHEESIISEGWHQQFGGPHAEVNAIRQAALSGQTDLSETTLYVSLEPCVHYGKTPPCTDLIILHKIPKVVIGCHDPFRKADGKGIEKLKAAGVEVEVGVLEKECKELNKRFFIFQISQRPYVVLKWAQTNDGFISTSPQTPLRRRGASGDPNTFRLIISNEYSNRLVHKWRSEEASILVGTNTAMLDDPGLTTRLWPGPSPVRLVVDMNLRLPSAMKIFDQQVRTIIFNTAKHGEDGNLFYYQLKNDMSLVLQVMNALYKLNIQSVLVEGGAKLLQSFIDEGIWDEARVISNMQLEIGKGLSAPVLTNAAKTDEQILSTDKIEIYGPKTAAKD